MVKVERAFGKCNFLRKNKMYMYMLLTALTFYFVAFMLAVPAVGPLSSPVVKSLVFVVLHVLTHKMLKGMRK